MLINEFYDSVLLYKQNLSNQCDLVQLEYNVYHIQIVN